MRPPAIPPGFSCWPGCSSRRWSGFLLLQTLQNPVERRGAENEGEHQRRTAIAAEAAVRAEIEIAQDVVAPAHPQPIRTCFVADHRIEQSKKKRKESAYHHSRDHFAASLIFYLPCSESL